MYVREGPYITCVTLGMGGGALKPLMECYILLHIFLGKMYLTFLKKKPAVQQKSK